MVNDKDYLKAKKLLAENGITTDPATEKPIPFLRKSDTTVGESPSSFGLTMNAQ
jgi:threonine synthase